MSLRAVGEAVSTPARGIASAVRLRSHPFGRPRRRERARRRLAM